jgi:acetyl esterase/lipase
VTLRQRLRRMRLMATIGVSMLLTGCSGLALLDNLTAHTGYTVERDVAYGPSPRQRFDIYRPLIPIDPARPVLVFFYGGSWMMGERSEYRFIGQSFASAGYITVVADYRLYPEVRFPDFIEDGATVVARVAQDIPGAAGHIVLVGHSAGAYIAALLACDRRYLDAAGPGRQVLAGFIGAAGPYDFEPNGLFAKILASPDGRSNMPIDLPDGHEPPTLLMVAEGDDTVWPANSEHLAAKMAALGDSVQLRRYQGPSHATLVAAMGTAMSAFAPGARGDILDFLQARTKADRALAAE